MASVMMASGAVTTPMRPPPSGRPGGLRDRAADLQLGVALQDLVALHEAGQVGLIGHVEEDGQDAVDEADDVQLLDASGRPARRRRGSRAGSTARPRSPTMRMGRRRRRSTQAPAGRLNRMNGRNSMVPSRATSKGVAPSRTMATSGIASRLTCVPNWLMVSADPQLQEVAMMPEAARATCARASRGRRGLAHGRHPADLSAGAAPPPPAPGGRVRDRRRPGRTRMSAAGRRPIVQRPRGPSRPMESRRRTPP